MNRMTLVQIAEIDRARERTNAVPRISEFSVWSGAYKILRQYPEISCLVAAQRADAAYSTGQTFQFQFWGRVTLALMEWLRERTKADAVH